MLMLEENTLAKSVFMWTFQILWLLGTAFVLFKIWEMTEGSVPITAGFAIFLALGISVLAFLAKKKNANIEKTLHELHASVGGNLGEESRKASFGGRTVNMPKEHTIFGKHGGIGFSIAPVGLPVGDSAVSFWLVQVEAKTGIEAAVCSERSASYVAFCSWAPPKKYRGFQMNQESPVLKEFVDRNEKELGIIVKRGKAHARGMVFITPNGIYTIDSLGLGANELREVLDALVTIAKRESK